jgi:hypothetical protein
MPGGSWNRSDVIPRVVAFAWAATVVTPLVLAVTRTRPGFWHHTIGPTVLILFVFLIGSVLRRHRWAWFFWVAFELFIVISFTWSFSSVLDLVLNVVSLALLISPPMRAYVLGRRSPTDPQPAVDPAQ